MIETNTFSGTTIAQADYLMEDLAYELNKVHHPLSHLSLSLSLSFFLSLSPLWKKIIS
jgi:hypothetical protein